MNVQPQVGMGASVVRARHQIPATITEIQHFKSGARKGQIRRIGVREDKWTVVNGNEWDGTAEYEYDSDETAPVVWFMNNQDGCWMSPQGVRAIPGVRERYYDPHF